MPVRFVLLIGVSAALTLIRGFAVAALITVEDFAVFAVLVAIGALSSTLLGLGRIEGTMKSFPRAWVAGQAKHVCSAADDIVRVVLIRSVPFVALAAVIAATGQTSWAMKVVMIAGIALGAALMGVYSSTLRASGNLELLGRATFFRSILALALCTGGAAVMGWYGAILGEVLAALIGALQARRAGWRLVPPAPTAVNSTQGAGPLATESLSGGRWLLLAMLAGSVPFYLDRLFVDTVFGSTVAGQYGFLMLFVTGAATLSGIIVQKVGPELVKAHAKGTVTPQRRAALRWLGAHVAIAVSGVVVWGFVIIHGPLSFLGQRYGLSMAHVFGTSLLAAMQGTVILDWLLLSRDRERLVFYTAMVYLASISVAALWFSLFATDASLAELILGIALAKLGHVLSQAVMVYRSSRVEDQIA